MAASALVESRAIRALLFVLSLIAGCTDVIGFLGLNGLFTAHITGNLVLVTAHFARSGHAQVAQILAVPVFIVVAGLTATLADRLESVGTASLAPLLLLQFILLAGFFVMADAIGQHTGANAGVTIVAGMLGVSAMAVQHVLAQTAFGGAPTTAVMTGNVTRFAIDVSKMLSRADPERAAQARRRASQTLPVIVGFTVGCGLGAMCETALGLKALALPASLALFALSWAIATRSDTRISPKR